VNTLDGAAWQTLRSWCLDTIPRGSRAPFSRPVPLHEWRTNGAFRVDACTSHEIVLETAGVEIGSALLSDSEHFLDHASEHHATLLTWIDQGVWHSPGWSVVTIYYWAFFLALALTRLVGRTSWFLDREALTRFRQLANSSVQPPAGALDLSVGPYVGSVDRRVLLRPTKKQFHDAVWRNVAQILTDLSPSSDRHSGSLEQRTLQCFSIARSRMPNAWPSLVRNAVNYLPGCGYREVIRKTDIDIARYLKRSAPFSDSDMVSEFEDHLLRVSTPFRPVFESTLLCRLLLLFTLIMSGVTISLHSELLERNSLDRRWRSLRDSFLQDTGVQRDGVTWPFGEKRD
jgi:hypothetical protein